MLTKGRKQSPESVAKRAASNTGKKRGPWSDEVKEIMSKGHKADAILQLNMDGKLIAEWRNIEQAVKQLGISRGVISVKLL